MGGQAIGHGFGGGEPEIPVRILFHLLDGLARGIGDHLVQAVPHDQHFAGLDADVGHLAAHAAAWPVQQEARVGHHVAILLVGGEIDVGAGTGHPARTQHAHARLDELDGVMDHVAGFHVAAGRRYDHGDRIIAGLGQRKQVDADALGQRVVDLAGDHHDAGFKVMLVHKPRILDAARRLIFFAQARRRGGEVCHDGHSLVGDWDSVAG